MRDIFDLLNAVAKRIEAYSFIILPLMYIGFFCWILMLIRILLVSPESASLPEMRLSIAISLVIAIGAWIEARDDRKIVRDWWRGKYPDRDEEA